MKKLKSWNRIYKVVALSMNNLDIKNQSQVSADPIDDYLECVTYCSISNSAEENDCQTICMERHLKRSYF